MGAKGDCVWERENVVSANVSTSGCMNESILRVPPVVKTTVSSGRPSQFYTPVKHAANGFWL